MLIRSLLGKKKWPLSGDRGLFVMDSGVKQAGTGVGIKGGLQNINKEEFKEMLVTFCWWGNTSRDTFLYSMFGSRYWLFVSM